MAAITMTLGNGAEIKYDAEDMIVKEISKNGKQPNVSMFAFTATPKSTTFQLFGRDDIHGNKVAFHLYSMKQAIEEGFILDVLQNYVTYDTYFQLNKEIKDDPKLKTNDAKRQIARFIQLTPTAIYDSIAKIEGYFFLDPADVEAFNTLLYESKHTAKDKKQMTFYLQKAKRVTDGFKDATKTQCAMDIRHFIRFYEFLLQASCFEDTELHKKYNFLNYLISYIKINHPGGGYNLDGKIKATGFVQKKTAEHEKADIKSDPVMKLPTAY